MNLKLVTILDQIRNATFSHWWIAPDQTKRIDEWVKRFHVSEEDDGDKVEAVFEEVMRDMGMPVRKRRARNSQGQ